MYSCNFFMNLSLDVIINSSKNIKVVFQVSDVTSHTNLQKQSSREYLYINLAILIKKKLAKQRTCLKFFMENKTK